jgi:hypothetical protein
MKKVTETICCDLCGSEIENSPIGETKITQITSLSYVQLYGPTVVIEDVCDDCNRKIVSIVNKLIK